MTTCIPYLVFQKINFNFINKRSKMNNNEEQNNHPINNNNNDNNQEQLEETVTKRLNFVCTLLIILVFARLFILDIFAMISDIITAFILYFTYSTKNNFMAIFSLLNGIIGILLTLAKGITDMTTLYNHTGFFRFMFILIFIYALIVYFLVIFYSYKAMKIYQGLRGQAEPRPYSSPSNNYGAVDVNRTNNNYVPFAGRGTTIGGD